MDLAINRVKLLYVVGVALGIAAVFYFGFQILNDLSPTTTAILLLFGFGLFAIAGSYVTTETLDTVFYALAAGAYIVFLAYTASRFTLSETGVFLLLAISSALFIGLGYLSHTHYLTLTQRQAELGMLAILGCSALLIGVDGVGAQPSYTSEFEDSIEVPATRTDATIGTVTASNEFILSRTIDPPEYHACLYTPEYHPIPLVRYRDSPQTRLLGGGESRTFELTIGQSVFYDRLEPRDDLQNVSSIPVEQMARCPDQSPDVKLVVVPGEIRPPG